MTSAASASAPHRLAGVAWILLASVSFSGMGAVTKVAMADGNVFDVVFWRSVIVSSVAWGLMRRGPVPLRPGNPKLVAARAVVGVVAMLLFFWSLGQIELGTATTLLYTSPLFTVLLSGRVLGEQRHRATLPLTAAAFVGVALIMRPTGADAALGAAAALAAGFLASLAYLAVRRLRETDPPARIVFWFSLSAVVVCAGPSLATGLPEHASDWLALLGVGLFATGGQLAMTRAYRLERASVVGPFSYATVVISYLLGLAIWSEVLSLEATLGMALVVVAGALLGRTAQAEEPPAAAATSPPRPRP